METESLSGVWKLRVRGMVWSLMKKYCILLLQVHPARCFSGCDAVSVSGAMPNILCILFLKVSVWIIWMRWKSREWKFPKKSFRMAEETWCWGCYIFCWLLATFESIFKNFWELKTHGLNTTDYLVRHLLNSGPKCTLGRSGVSTWEETHRDWNLLLRCTTKTQTAGIAGITPS